jgi:putative methyltransferase (TIGR04325 family)
MSFVSSALGRNPLVARAQARWVRLRGWGNRFFGVFPDFAAAEAAIPTGARVGYDHDELAGFYRDRLDRIALDDYPVVYWLRRFAAELTDPAVFDFGGHVGVHRFAYGRYLERSLPWLVCDVASVARAGAALARERGAAELTFTSDASDGDGRPLFLSAGALQYLPAGHLARVLGAMENPPKHLVLSKLPVHDEEAFVTLQDTGVSVHPYTIFRRKDFLGELQALGYRVADEWKASEHHCRILFEPRRSVLAYSGFALSRS